MMNPWAAAQGQTFGTLAPQMRGYEFANLGRTGNQAGMNPFAIRAGNTYAMGGQTINGSSYGSNAVDRENVQASQGAGASAGADWTSRLGQMAQQGAQQDQRQQELARAAFMRNTPTPGGMQSYGMGSGADAQRWGQMMQGLQGMRQGMQSPPRGNRF